jgi:hypothetical protein
MKRIVWFIVTPSLIGFPVRIVALLGMLIFGLIGLFHGRLWARDFVDSSSLSSLRKAEGKSGSA